MAKWLLGIGCSGAVIGCLPLFLLLVVLIGMMTVVGDGQVSNHLPIYSSGGQALPVVSGGNNAVTLAAKQMSAHLDSSCLGKNPECEGDAQVLSGFPVDILRWGRSHCLGCRAWWSDRFQCVSYVLGAYSRLRPLDLSGNGGDFWGIYSTLFARSLGYVTIPAQGGGLPLSAGDIMAWTGGRFGHVSIVLGWKAPRNGQPGLITFGQANGQYPVQSLPLLPDGRVDTANGYWNGFLVQGYIHPPYLPVTAGTSSAQRSPQLRIVVLNDMSRNPMDRRRMLWGH